MRIAVFTGNYRRHLSLIRLLADVADEVVAVQECVTVFPGVIDDRFAKSPIMDEYFQHVTAAELAVFGSLKFSPPNVRTLSLKLEDLNLMSIADLEPALSCDLIVVFGACYIKGDLIERLVEKKAVNIHMGISPYYRGNSCNFWALHDGRADMVGATIHRLSKGLDSGEMMFHAVPAPAKIDPFLYGMQAVKAAHHSLVERIRDGSLLNIEQVAQDKSQELRYTRNADFNDDVAKRYLESAPTAEMVYEQASARDLDAFIDPFVY